jgi:hypothetical protein
MFVLPIDHAHKRISAPVKAQRIRIRPPHSQHLKTPHPNTRFISSDQL